jgi:hypothetical protein
MVDVRTTTGQVTGHTGEWESRIDHLG